MESAGRSVGVKPFPGGVGLGKVTVINDSMVGNSASHGGILTRGARLVLSTVGLAALAMLALAAPAAAHGGAGLIEVGDPEATGELQIEFPVRITYENDGHPADEVEGLTVSGKGPDGAELAATDAFVPGDAPGVFRATVTLPVEGQWELTVDSTEPAATATITADVAGATVVEPESPAAGDAPDAGGEDDAGAGDTADDPADAEDGSGDDTVGSGAPADDLDGAQRAPLTREESDDGGFPVVPVVIAVLVAGAAALVGFRLATNRRSS